MDTMEDLYYDDTIDQSYKNIVAGGLRLARLTLTEVAPTERASQTAERVALAWKLLAADADPLNSPL